MSETEQPAIAAIQLRQLRRTKSRLESHKISLRHGLRLISASQQRIASQATTSNDNPQT